MLSNMRIIPTALLLVASLPAQTPKSQMDRVDNQDQSKKNANSGKGSRVSPQPGAVQQHPIEQPAAASPKYQANTYTPSRTDLSNWVLVFVGFVGTGAAFWTAAEIRRQSRISSQAAAAAKLSAEAANKSIILPHRPRLIVRRFRAEDPERFVAKDSDVLGFCDVVNIGSSPATIIAAKTNVFTAAILPAVAPYPSELNVFDAAVPFRLQPGGHATIRFCRIVPLVEHEAQAIRITSFNPRAMHDQPDRVYPFIYGAIEYTDEFGTVMRMGFARFFDTYNGRFKPTEDADYEYAD